MEAKDYLCVGLDLTDRDEILGIVDELKDHVGYFKLNAAFTLYGPDLVAEIIARGGKIFLDLKFHDIPHTVGRYAEACVQMGVSIFNIHIAGGYEMMRSAVQRCHAIARDKGLPCPKIIGVTIMTSVNKGVMNDEIGIPGTVAEQVLHYAHMGADAGLDGIVSSAQDLDGMRKHLPDEFYFITPGIRPTGSDHQDQKRATTPSAAIKAGSSLLVVGRPILNAGDRIAAAKSILNEIDTALRG